MRFLADESIEDPVFSRLRDEGYDVVDAAESEAGASDERVLERAETSSRILLTKDKDFAALAFRQQRATVGIVLLRMVGASSVEKAERPCEVLSQGSEKLPGHMVVVEHAAIRRRPLPKMG